jgi:phosphoribosyl 1,2-cyclic phosphate phosphodiesterase
MPTSMLPTTNTFTVIGCGPSTAVPHPSCSCATCTSTDSRNFRMRPSGYLRTTSGKNYLIDASPDIKEQALKFKIERVDGIFITHAHSDHILGLDYLRLYNYMQKGAIPIYATPLTLRQIKHFFNYIFYPDPNYKGGKLAQFIPIEIDDMSVFTVDELSVQPFRMLHGDIRSTGYRIGDISYATDCHYIPQASLDIISGSSILIIDALMETPHPTHFSVDQAVKVAQKLGIPRSYLVHMTHQLEYSQLLAQLPPDVEPAYDGLTLPVNLNFSRIN